jgi:L-fuculose-phosphate aldolase
VALTLAGEELLPCMPEAVTALGDVPTARYATPGTSLVAEAVRPHLRKADCVLMERHGALAMGFGHRALFDGCDKIEMIEGVARVQLLASLRRPPTPLSADECRALDAQREANLKRVKSPPRPWERDR